MFSRRLVRSARFLKLSPTAQMLYFHLNMEADDDGAVDAYPVMRLIGACDGDLAELAQNKFLTILTDDPVCHLSDWNENNAIRTDRHTDSIYKDLLEANGLYFGNRVTTDCQPNDTPGKDRLGKEKVGKVREGKERKGQEKTGPSPCPLSSSNVLSSPVENSPQAVKLCEEEIEDLLKVLCTADYDKYYAIVAQAELSGKHYKKSHYDAILDMAKKDGVIP